MSNELSDKENAAVNITVFLFFGLCFAAVIGVLWLIGSALSWDGCMGDACGGVESGVDHTLRGGR